MWSCGSVSTSSPEHTLLSCRVSCDEVRRPLKRKGIAGGSWRAFVALRSRGNRGPPDLQQLAVEYRQAKTAGGAAWASVAQVGRAAKLAGRKRGRSAFGPKTRDVARESLKQARTALWARTADMEPLTRATYLAEHGALQKGNLAHSLAIARKQQQMDGAARRKALEEKKATLTAWQDSVGKQQVGYFLAQHAAVGLCRTSLVAVPSPVAVSIEELPAPKDEAIQGAAWASHSRSSNVGISLQREWEERHSTVLQKDCDDIMTPNPDTKCRYYGHCVCSAPGRQLFQLRNAVLAAMKLQFGSKEGRDSLCTGRVVILLKGQAMSLETDLDEQGDEEINEHWLHISAMYFKPYRPSFTRLARIACPAHEDATLDRVHLQVLQLERMPNTRTRKVANCWTPLLERMSNSPVNPRAARRERERERLKTSLAGGKPSALVRHGHPSTSIP